MSLRRSLWQAVGLIEEIKLDTQEAKAQVDLTHFRVSRCIAPQQVGSLLLERLDVLDNLGSAAHGGRWQGGQQTLQGCDPI